MKLKRLFFFVCVATLTHVQAAEISKSMAVVNGVKIGQDLLEQMVRINVAQGGKDTPELRSALKGELISREVLVQEARRQKIDQESAVRTQLQLQQNNLLADSLIVRQAEKFNITDEKLRTEYKRQVDLLADAEEYQLSHVVTATESEARSIIKAAKDGESFEKLAREKSINSSRQNGGLLGWMLVDQIVPALANVVVTLPVGNVTPLPIPTQEGWQVIRLDGKRKFKIPSFEDSKQQLVNAVFANERAEYVQKLLKAAKIED